MWDRRCFMNCRLFEESLSEYLDGELSPREAARFAEHALQCRTCRAQMDDVKAVLRECKAQSVDASANLESALLRISADHAELDCPGFEELITDFLDGFVPAPNYHRFESHAARCGCCSALLTDVVLAVAACHSVHTYEEHAVPVELAERIIGIAATREQSKRAAIGLVQRIVRPFAKGRLRWAPANFATASALAAATFAVFVIGFSEDRSPMGIYREARVRAAEFYSEGEELLSQKDDIVAGVRRVGSDIGEIWDTIGEVESPAPATRAQENSAGSKGAPAGQK